ncbi:hypothetical protein BSU04_03985 [Caballeronia sordidicola]|uniref:Uncharacterized protein n=1 Tax=Caballeronia sordidicola TaxID=196367 RepID=A0A226X901_CABSO|nr:hypothetical protein BSU04_03985 [Caballeronia sordidicola]
MAKSDLTLRQSAKSYGRAGLSRESNPTHATTHNDKIPILQ